MNVQIQVLHSSDFDGATWYAIRVRENHQEWLVQKRFRQFVELDSQLVYSGLSRLPLPQKGTLGLRKAFSRSWMESRREALAAYMAHLAVQLNSLSQVPALQQFLLPPVPPGGVVVGTPVSSASYAVGRPVPMAPLAVEGPVDMLPSAPTRGEMLRSDLRSAMPSIVPGRIQQRMMDRNIRRLAAVVDAMDAAGVKISCGHCNDRGFLHSSHMEHDMPEHERCFFCRDCQVCRGMGCQQNHLKDCGQCHGHGFLHKSGLRHDQERHRRCFFCETCSRCRGQGLTASTAFTTL